MTTHPLWGPGQVMPSLSPPFLLCKRERGFLPLDRNLVLRVQEDDMIRTCWGGHTGSVPGSLLGSPWEPTGRDCSGFCVLSCLSADAQILEIELQGGFCSLFPCRV